MEGGIYRQKADGTLEKVTEEEPVTAPVPLTTPAPVSAPLPTPTK
jgi:hypothetical protein